MYDSAKTRSLLTMAGGFANFPTGEYITDLAKQLTDAEAEITLATNAKLKAEGEANRYASELATMQSTMRQLREENDALKRSAPVAPVAPAPAEIVKPKRAPRPIVVTEPTPPPAAAPAAPAVPEKRPKKKKAESAQQ